MKAQIISIGDELTIGQAVDTNSAWLAQQLAAVGIHCARHVTVADDRAQITSAIKEAATDADIVLISGGLGPTPDDVTREALADAMGAELVLDHLSLERVEAFFRARNRTMHAHNRNQAMCPAGAEPIENTCGTAPGIHARIGRAEIYVMPGVPREMKVMFEGGVLPLLPRNAGEIIIQRTLRTFGMSESELGERIADLMQRGRNSSVGTSAADLVISIRIVAHGASRDEASRIADADAAVIRDRLGTIVFGEEACTIQEAAARLLVEQGKTISTAESCTGGLIAKRLTDVSGSSAYLIQGFVAYANESKRRLLCVPMDLIERHGAVSAPVAESMATNCRRISGTDYALSATGVAGPTGGSPEKPVGLVYIGLADANTTLVKELRLGDTLTRDEVRDRTAKAALNMLRLRLLGRL